MLGCSEWRNPGRWGFIVAPFPCCTSNRSKREVSSQVTINGLLKSMPAEQEVPASPGTGCAESLQMIY